LDFNESTGGVFMIFQELLINMEVLNSGSNTIMTLVLEIYFLQRKAVCTDQIA
jgi:hypothetical protein